MNSSSGKAFHVNSLVQLVAKRMRESNAYILRSMIDAAQVQGAVRSSSRDKHANKQLLDNENYAFWQRAVLCLDCRSAPRHAVVFSSAMDCDILSFACERFC